MPTFFLICHLSFDARGLAEPEESHALSQADLFDPKKIRANHFSFGVWACMEGLRPQDVGRPYIAAMHAGRRACHWLLGMQSQQQNGWRKVSAHQPGTSCRSAATRQGKGGRNARKGQRHHHHYHRAINDGAALRLSRSVRPTQDTDPPAGYNL